MEADYLASSIQFWPAFEHIDVQSLIFQSLNSSTNGFASQYVFSNGTCVQTLFLHVMLGHRSSIFLCAQTVLSKQRRSCGSFGADLADPTAPTLRTVLFTMKKFDCRQDFSTLWQCVAHLTNTCAHGFGWRLVVRFSGMARPRKRSQWD